MEKLNIKNRKGEKISILLNGEKNQDGLVFIMHGHGGFKEQNQLTTISEAFLENNFTVVLFDATKSIGESEGSYEEGTFTNHYEDLEDVIKWAEKQSWYKEPFYLTGHSMGGMCIMLYAENYPEKVKALSPVATAITGKGVIDDLKKRSPEEFKKLKEEGL